jgi:hypothetical protein
MSKHFTPPNVGLGQWPVYSRIREYSADLDALPHEVVVPAELEGRIWFDPVRGRLVSDGSMTWVDHDRMRRLSNDATYQRALDQLFQACSANPRESLAIDIAVDRVLEGAPSTNDPAIAQLGGLQNRVGAPAVIRMWAIRWLPLLAVGLGGAALLAWFMSQLR